ncbi:cupin domain-containing protein [Mucilaginibacter sp. SMC90]|uniref:cupin domain-containing protein n=1 Tax=Mucilaginibacter sp. SMC90 TaxID=2929803 RepID=UPI001FB3C903|nr:cupin domain-containing protein [Mucilaginibacter sp. SMC90]UOE51731.1 cupin domain-containing protein [Mucilaginibacter sp. SMC90]
MKTQNAAYYIQSLNLLPHPEGGYYKETFRSEQEVSRVAGADVKQACTSIYYLLEDADFSGFHRIASDEIWYFHKGQPLIIHVIQKDGSLISHELSDENTGSFSVVVQAGLWFAAELKTGEGFALVSCAVAPGFDFSEFEMAKREELVLDYPQHQALLTRMCRE